MSNAGQVPLPALAERQRAKWVWGTALAWAVAWAALPTSVIFGLERLLVLVFTTAVPLIQALFLRRPGRPLSWWGPVAWLGIAGGTMTIPYMMEVQSTIPSIGRRSAYLFALNVVATLPGWLGQGLLLRREYALPRMVLAVLVLTWGAAWWLSFQLAWFILLAFPMFEHVGAGGFVFLFLILLLPGLIFGYGTGWPLARARPKG